MATAGMQPAAAGDDGDFDSLPDVELPINIDDEEDIPAVAINVAKAERWILSVRGIPDPDAPGHYLPFPRAEHHVETPARVGRRGRLTVDGDFCRFRCAPNGRTMLVLQGLVTFANEKGEAFDPDLTHQLVRKLGLSESTVRRELQFLERFFPCRRLKLGERFPKKREWNHKRKCYGPHRARLCRYGGRGPSSSVYDLGALLAFHPYGEEKPDWYGLGSSRLEAFSKRHTLTPAARATRAALNSWRYKGNPCPGAALLSRQTLWSKRMIRYAFREQEGGPPGASVWPSAGYVSKRDGQKRHSARRAPSARSPVPIMTTKLLKPGETFPDGGVVRVGAAERVILPLPKRLVLVPPEATPGSTRQIESDAVRQIRERYLELFGSDGDEKNHGKLCRAILATKKAGGKFVSLGEVLRALDAARSDSWYMETPHRHELRELIGSFRDLKRCGGRLDHETDEAAEIAALDAELAAERAASKIGQAEARALQASGQAKGMTAPKPNYIDKRF